LGGEPRVSDNLEDSRRADEESELRSILTHPTPRKLHCQPQAPFKKPTDCLDRGLIVIIARRVIFEQPGKQGAGSNNSQYAHNTFFLKLSNIEQQFIPGWPTIGWKPKKLLLAW
jgi:hypothetical protein